MLEHGEWTVTHDPWPIAGTVLTRQPGALVELHAQGKAAGPLRKLQDISLSATCEDQQQALQEHLGGDIYVATYSLLQRGEGPNNLISWCSWSEGITSLLPKTDVIAFVRDVGTQEPAMMLVAWDEAARNVVSTMILGGSISNGGTVVAVERARITVKRCQQSTL